MSLKQICPVTGGTMHIKVTVTLRESETIKPYTVSKVIDRMSNQKPSLPFMMWCEGRK